MKEKKEFRIFLGDNYGMRYTAFAEFHDIQRKVIAQRSIHTETDVMQAERGLQICDWIVVYNIPIKIRTKDRKTDFVGNNFHHYFCFEKEEDAVECALRFGETIIKVYPDE